MKVLIISGMPFRNDTNTGKTLMTLFSDLNSDEMRQLYFSPETPNVNRCDSCYRICEKEIVKSVLGIRKNICGGVVLPVKEGANAGRPETNAGFITKHKTNISVRCAREALWKYSLWENDNFKKWISEEKPDVIFAFIQDTNISIKIINKISDKINCPIVLFITDDYYNDYEKSNNFIRKSYYRKRRKLYAKLSANISTLVGCSSKATEYFSKEFNVPNAETVYTPSAEIYFKMPYKEQGNSNIVKIRYFGNLGLGRWKILKQLGETVRQINSDGVKAILEVYSSVTDSEIINALSIENGCVYKGWVYGDEYLKLLQSADIAVHVESFDDDMIRRTWASISTKIADYLGAGKCILAIGSKDLASIEHIKDVSCAVNDISSLRNKLERLIDDPDMRTELQHKARKLAEKEHNISDIKTHMRKILEDAVK